MTSDSQSPESERVLLVGTHGQLAGRMRQILERSGYVAVRATSAVAVCDLANSDPLVSVLYFAESPPTSVADEIELLSTHFWGTPLVAVVARSTDGDASFLLQCGADDCIGHDCADSEVIARVRAHQRRTQKLTRVTLFSGRFMLDLHTHQLSRRVERATQWVYLLPKEFVLIRALSQHAGETMPHRQLDYLLQDGEGVVSRLSQYRLVARTNARLSEIGGIRIYSVHGVGYRIGLEVSDSLDLETR
jgi:DNA-binding response OmpR family regulator